MEIINREGKIETFKFEEKKSEKKIDFEFQAMGVEMEPFYGKAIWPMFYKYPLVKIRDAHEACKRRGITTIGYLIGVMKKMK